MHRPSLEAAVSKRARRDSIRSALLITIALADALPIALAAPKVFTLIKEKHLDAIIPKDPKQRLRETASRLKRKGLIDFRIVAGKKRMMLTPEGKAELLKIQSHSHTPIHPRRWDTKWRIVIFDIPEKQHTQRATIRSLLRRIGFLRLQNSVWVYPYDCEEIIALLKSDLKIGRNVLYLIADAIEFDRPLREAFDLPVAA